MDVRRTRESDRHIDPDRARGRDRSSPSETTRLRIAIADDDRAVLSQVERLLARFDIVARASNGRRLIEAVDRTRPDIVVTDFSMPEVNGVEATRAIVRLKPDVKVVILSIYDDPVYVEAAFEAGVSAYVLKIDASTELLTAIDGVRFGRTYRSRRLR